MNINIKILKNKTITNNPDGTYTVTSWDELAQVINANATATIIVDGMLVATSQIEIADAKNITIKGINPNDPESGIIYEDKMTVFYMLTAREILVDIENFENL